MSYRVSTPQSHEAGASGKTWKIPTEKILLVEQLIKEFDAKKQPTPGQYETWRYNVGKSQFTMYTSGSLYNNQMSDDTVELRRRIDVLVQKRFKTTGATMRLGMDETGKGEVLGDAILCCACYPDEIASDVEAIIGQADTKNYRSLGYWNAIRVKIKALQNRGLEFQIRAIPPATIDRYHLHKTMDIVYKAILSDTIRGKTISECSVVLDDYHPGDVLKVYLDDLSDLGAKVIVEEKADDTYLEAKLASVLAKEVRNNTMNAINEGFKINDLIPGSGNTFDSKTTNWLHAWKADERPWPPFVRTSYYTVRKIDGLTKVKKQIPPTNRDFVTTNTKDISAQFMS